MLPPLLSRLWLRPRLRFVPQACPEKRALYHRPYKPSWPSARSSFLSLRALSLQHPPPDLRSVGNSDPAHSFPAPLGKAQRSPTSPSSNRFFACCPDFRSYWKTPSFVR